MVWYVAARDAVSGYELCSLTLIMGDEKERGVL